MLNIHRKKPTHAARIARTDLLRFIYPSERLRPALAVLSIAILGSATLVITHAASSNVAAILNATQGKLSGGASIVTDAGASNGKAIRFSSPPPPPVSETGALSPLHVSGNKLVNASGNTVTLHGVDKMGTEYMCEGGGIFDNGGFSSNNNTPPGTNFITALKSWNVNAVRIPLAEDCWLGINGVATGGSVYQQGIAAFVNELNQNHIYAILDLHWAAGGTTVPKQQYGMADTDHSPAFWASVANTFKGNNSVIFDLYNEPTIGDWGCWRNGGCQTNGYTVAGMQQLLTSVRSTGATNVVMIGGLGSANDLTGWLANEPQDTLNPSQIAASWHTYDSSVTWNCSTSNLSCMEKDWNNNLAGVPAKVPVITGEFGEFDCSSTYANQLMPFMDQNGMSYLAWTFTPAPNCSNGPILITDANGTPTSNGAGIKAHYLTLGP